MIYGGDSLIMFFLTIMGVHREIVNMYGGMDGCGEQLEDQDDFIIFRT